jgi:hypothetical protein
VLDSRQRNREDRKGSVLDKRRHGPLTGGDTVVHRFILLESKFLLSVYDSGTC